MDIARKSEEPRPRIVLKEQPDGRFFYYQLAAP